MPFNNQMRRLWKEAGYRTDMGSAAAATPPPADFVRLYHLTSATHALSNIVHGRLKVARFLDLNDPFELLSINVMDKQVRAMVRENRSVMSAHTGLICFSEDWTSPVMWSHYADRHRGICLGFDVLRSSVKEVSYNATRILLELEKDADPLSLPPHLQDALLVTKCAEWSYERERRLLAPLNSEEVFEVGPLYFRRFDASLRLAEVILGPNCAESVEEVRRVVQTNSQGAITFKARPAWQHFKVVPLESTVP
jgi:hypothetical protein